MQISYGTQWNEASIGCTNCIKIKFADGEVLLLAIQYDAIVIYSNKWNFIMVFKTFGAELE